MKQNQKNMIALIIAVVIVICWIFMKSRGRTEMLDPKEEVRLFIQENERVLTENYFLAYGEFKKLTDDTEILRDVLTASKDGDISKLYKILDKL